MKIALCLYGYYNNRRDKTAGDKGYEYIKTNILDKVDGDIDIFIHTWEVDLEKKIANLYKPFVAVKEKQIDFNPIAKNVGVDEEWINEGYNRKGTTYQQCSIQASLSFYYSRMKAIELKTEFERKHKFKYNCVIVARFDLGHTSNWHKGYNVSLMPFNQTLDMEYIYSAMWQQLNAGYADQWFFSNTENINKLGMMYHDVVDNYFQKDSEYYYAITNGWFDSDESNEFSNEIIKKNDLVIHMKYPKWQMINNHILHKWHMKEMGLYEKSKFLGEKR